MSALLGIVVAIIFLGGYLPQLKTIIKEKDLSGISITFWCLIALATMVTFGNLWESHAVWYVLYPQMINAIIGAVIFFMVVFKKEGGMALWISLWGYGFLSYMFVYIAPNEFIQHSATVFIVLAYLEQIFYFLINKTAKGVNPMLFIAFGVALGIMAFNIIITGAPISTAYTEIANLVMILICLGLTYKYKKLDNKTT